MVDGEVFALSPVNQKSGKVVHAFACEADIKLDTFASNTFEIEWPPKSGRHQSFPEIDRIAYFVLPVAMKKIIAYQQPFLRELEGVPDLTGLFFQDAGPIQSHHAAAPKVLAAPPAAIRPMLAMP